jgi:ABC-type Fe3+/spermidine/putrescine transport system ATPase subunit
LASLTVEALERRFEDGVVALRDVSFAVEDGRVAALLGPSGCGKTTVLRLIAGLDRPDAGDVLIDGQSVLGRPPHRRGIGLMFQELALFPHLDVTQNIEFGLRMANWPRAAREARIAQLLSLMGLAGFGKRRIHELSSGERQRVALARTLAPQPEVLLLDEPLGALDETLKQELRGHLREVLTRLRTTALIVSHDLRDAVAVADDIVVMDEGAVLQAGALSAVLGSPRSVRVASLLGYVSIAQGPVENGRVVEKGVGAVPVPDGLSLGGQAQVLAHPSSLLAVPPDGGLGCGVEGTVLASRPDGPTQLVDVALDEQRVVQARWEWDLAPPANGAKVALAARPGTLRFFRVLDEWEPVEHVEPPESGDDRGGENGGPDDR